MTAPSVCRDCGQAVKPLGGFWVLTERDPEEWTHLYCPKALNGDHTPAEPPPKPTPTPLRLELPWQPMAEARILNPGPLLDEMHPHGWACYKNHLYTVLASPMTVDGWAGLVELSIRRNDRGTAKDWRHFQRIKNDIMGPDREGCELYPAQSRLVDNANQYHLWVLPVGASFPFGFQYGAVSDDEHHGHVMTPEQRAAATNAVQRPLPEDWLDR